VVQFSHFSVKEYLTSDRLARSSRDVSRYHIFTDPAHTILAQACFGVLLRLDDHVNKDNVDDIPLVEYAARHWVDHTRFWSVPSRIGDVVEYFFDPDKPHWTAWCRVQTIDVSLLQFTPDYGDQSVDDAFPLYYASVGGFYDLVEQLVGKHPEHINARGGRMVTPLVAALFGKHFKIAEILHRNGADVDIRDYFGETPLGKACWVGYPDIVHWLLNHDADMNTQAHKGWVPLHGAANHGRLQTLRMLVERNANIHIRNDLGETPFHVATSPQVLQDHVDIMRVLLDHGADPNSPDYDGSTPLHRSSWNKKGRYIATKGTVEGTRLLLKHGAIIDVEDNKGRTPLQLALEHGRHDIAACLLEHGATR
jgi:ankyrin repeat protein